MHCNKSYSPQSPIVQDLNMKAYHYHTPLYHTRRFTLDAIVSWNKMKDDSMTTAWSACHNDLHLVQNWLCSHSLRCCIACSYKMHNILPIRNVSIEGPQAKPIRVADTSWHKRKAKPQKRSLFEPHWNRIRFSFLASSFCCTLFTIATYFVVQLTLENCFSSKQYISVFSGRE